MTQPTTIDEAQTPIRRDDAELVKLYKRIWCTTYKVAVHFSQTSKETLDDKIMRLIRNTGEEIAG